MDALGRKPYSIDPTDAEWAVIEPLSLPPTGAGGPRKVNFPEVINAIFDAPTTGRAWKALPRDFLTPEGTVRD